MKILSHLRAFVPFLLVRRGRAAGPRILPLDPREQQQLDRARAERLLRRAERLARRTAPEQQA